MRWNRVAPGTEGRRAFPNGICMQRRAIAQSRPFPSGNCFARLPAALQTGPRCLKVATARGKRPSTMAITSCRLNWCPSSATGWGAAVYRACARCIARPCRPSSLFWRRLAGAPIRIGWLPGAIGEQLLLFVPGTGEMLPANDGPVHGDDLHHQAEADLSLSFFQSCRSAGGRLAACDQLIGCRNPL